MRWLSVAVSGLLLGACVTVGPVEMTLDGASIRAPVNVLGDIAEDINGTYSYADPGGLAALTKSVPPGVKLPLVVYFHGCAGMYPSGMSHLSWLSKLDDFAVVAPDSFARERPNYCFSNHTVTLALSSQVIAMRRNEMQYALKQLAKLSWVDKANIFLMGHSQGGGMAAAYAGPVKIRGRILVNGACYDGWGDGIADDEAVLSFDSGRDPWFYNNYRSDCRAYALRHPNGISVYDAESANHNLVARHWPVVRKFLKENRR